MGAGAGPRTIVNSSTCSPRDILAAAEEAAARHRRAELEAAERSATEAAAARNRAAAAGSTVEGAANAAAMASGGAAPYASPYSFTKVGRVGLGKRGGWGGVAVWVLLVVGYGQEGLGAWVWAGGVVVVVVGGVGVSVCGRRFRVWLCGPTPPRHHARAHRKLTNLTGLTWPNRPDLA